MVRRKLADLVAELARSLEHIWGMPALASAGAALMAIVRMVGPIDLKKTSAWRPNSRP